MSAHVPARGAPPPPDPPPGPREARPRREAPPRPEAPPPPGRPHRPRGNPTRARLRAKLSSREALRDAILLHEVLGPPVGLRPGHVPHRPA